MKRIILIKYGELTTKKDNRGFFIKTLKKNILNKLNGFNIEIKDDYYRMFIYCDEDDISKIVDVLKSIFGIHEIVICISSEDTSISNIKNISLDVMKKKDFETFKVETSRSDKSYPLDSMQISRNLGAYILKNKKAQIN